MSHSEFAARFTWLVGEPVMYYVARWRMNVALTSLRDDDTAIGLRVGSIQILQG